ncbi:MAG TPA: hypothetical protein PLA68_14020, partial [Panacibacter sp.]|nr:hypothetical protein [Panacibacter sp.]
MRKILLLLTFFSAFISNAQTFRISIADSLKQPALDGRLLLLLSKSNTAEPRFQVGFSANTQLVFGVNVDNWQPGSDKMADMHAFGYPLERLSDVPAGDYYVQVLLHKYETFHLQTGQTVKLPMDRGEGQHWNIAPGNIYSTPIKIHFDSKKMNEVHLVIDKIIPPIKEPEDTKYIKHIKIQSKLLTAFWGR